MQFSKTCLAAISNLLESRRDNDPCFYYNNLIAYVTQYDEDNDWEKYLLPNVIIWDPLTQIENLKLECPLCTQDGRSGIFLKKTNAWEKGNQSAQIPRKVWDYAWICILVGRTYRCIMQHSVRSYHAGVLRQINYDLIPFVLSHESGMTRTYLDSALRLIEEKSSFYQVRAITSKLFCDTFMHRRMMCPNKEFPNMGDLFKVTSPSEYLLRLGIQSYFKTNFWKYNQHFVDIPVKNLICDFVFHNEAVIGTASNRKWISSHDSLFIALNENSSIKSFKFTQGAQFEQVLKMLASLARVSDELSTLCIDNCCGLREILKEIFPNSEIKLHPVHVLRRLINLIPTNHPTYNEFVKDLRRLFRAKNDYFPNRHQPTPNSDILIENLSKFVDKWKDAETEGWSLITPAFAVELENIKMHIENGCLSNIPPDNYEEKSKVIAEHVSSVVLKNKFTIGDGQALMTHLIYSLNLKSKQWQNQKTKDYFCQVPIWSVKFPYVNKSILLVDNGSESVNTNSKDEVMEACASLQQLQSSVVVDNNEITVKCSSVKKVVTLIDVLLFLQSFDNGRQVVLPESFQALKFLSPAAITLHDFITLCNLKEPFPVKELSKIFVLEGYGIAQTKRQGLLVCLELLLRNLNSTNDLPEKYSQELKEILNTDNIANTLKELLKAEMLGERKEYYLSLFLKNNEEDIENTGENNSNDHFNVEENLFDDGFKLPHIFPVLIANTFHLNIVIIPLCNEMKMFPVFPNEIMTTKCSVLIYDCADHFYLPLMKIPNFSPCPKPILKNPAIRCACGANDRENRVRCAHGRCPCIKGGINCHESCRCRGCHNKKDDSDATKQAVKSSVSVKESQNDESGTDGEPPSKIQKLSRRKRHSHALSFKTFNSIDKNAGTIDKVKLDELKQTILQSLFYVDVEPLIQHVDEFDVLMITNIFLVYCKKFSSKFLEMEYDDQNILDGILMMEGDDIQTWMIDNMKACQLSENATPEDENITPIEDANLKEEEMLIVKDEEVDHTEEMFEDDTDLTFERQVEVNNSEMEVVQLENIDKDNKGDDDQNDVPEKQDENEIISENDIIENTNTQNEVEIVKNGMIFETKSNENNVTQSAIAGIENEITIKSSNIHKEGEVISESVSNEDSNVRIIFEIVEAEVAENVSSDNSSIPKVVINDNNDVSNVQKVVEIFENEIISENDSTGNCNAQKVTETVEIVTSN